MVKSASCPFNSVDAGRLPTILKGKKNSVFFLDSVHVPLSLRGRKAQESMMTYLKSFNNLKREKYVCTDL